MPTLQSTKRLDTEDFRYTEVYFLAVPLPLHLCQCFKFEIVESKPGLGMFLFDPENIVWITVSVALLNKTTLAHTYQIINNCIN